MTESECIFCDITSGRLTVPKIWESSLVTTFWDANPSAEKHILIVPKDHVANFQSLDNPALWEEMRQAAKQLITDQKLSAGYKLLLNGGKYQHIPHLHWHLLGGVLKANP